MRPTSYTTQRHQQHHGPRSGPQRPPATTSSTSAAHGAGEHHQQHHGQRCRHTPAVRVPYRTGTAWTPPKLRPAAYTAPIVYDEGKHQRAARITRAVVPFFSQSDSSEVTFSAPIRSRPGGSSPPVLLCQQTAPTAGSCCAPYEITAARNRST